MGKKSREKKARKEAKESMDGLQALLSPKTREEIARVTGEGDLRLVDAHIEAWLEGREEAEVALRMLGRDAASIVARKAEELGNAKLKELGQRLFALKPVVDTNLMALREVSVLDLLERNKEQAKGLEDGVEVDVKHACVLFDPELLVESLARGGKPRTDPNRIGSGDLAWFQLSPDDKGRVALAAGPAPEGAASLELVLNVRSGVIFVGAEDASDGPRLGEVRLDPFRTRLHEALDRGRLVRVDPGCYWARVVRQGPESFCVHLEKGAPEAPRDVALAELLCP